MSCIRLESNFILASNLGLVLGIRIGVRNGIESIQV